MPPQRYVLTCNGVAVPLQPTGRAGEFVAGVRYRAWQPA
ncbi:transglutaminase-like protein, partial [Pseudomonas syringae pv. japonica str. M301072]